MSNQPDPFKALLSVMRYEELLIFRKRMEAVKKKEILSLLSEEIDRRKDNQKIDQDLQQALLGDARQKATTMSFDHWLGNSEH